MQTETETADCLCSCRATVYDELFSRTERCSGPRTARRTFMKHARHQRPVPSPPACETGAPADADLSGVRARPAKGEFSASLRSLLLFAPNPFLREPRCCDGEGVDEYVAAGREKCGRSGCFLLEVQGAEEGGDDVVAMASWMTGNAMDSARGLGNPGRGSGLCSSRNASKANTSFDYRRTVFWPLTTAFKGSGM
eukprot:CAMPEP_0174901618 /NCGR_PEP_ID=MMETSP0167-20121228/35140_1 /TAXON_ID=38298 /ORGANISM="Rhodella maculata, Strain CCMP736" /LENGTH=194 /DNA_ID=CAMNT_0016143335 /DNA_START=48 /DNA_END=633 /DNA_ORIENTATION=-